MAKPFRIERPRSRDVAGSPFLTERAARGA